MFKYTRIDKSRKLDRKGAAANEFAELWVVYVFVKIAAKLPSIRKRELVSTSGFGRLSF